MSYKQDTWLKWARHWIIWGRKTVLHLVLTAFKKETMHVFLNMTAPCMMVVQNILTHTHTHTHTRTHTHTHTTSLKTACVSHMHLDVRKVFFAGN